MTLMLPSLRSRVDWSSRGGTLGIHRVEVAIPKFSSYHTLVLPAPDVFNPFSGFGLRTLSRLHNTSASLTESEEAAWLSPPPPLPAPSVAPSWNSSLAGDWPAARC